MKVFGGQVVWGVLGLLGSELAVEFALTDEECNPLRRAMVAEVASWQLDLVPRLAGEWQGLPGQLKDVSR